MQIRRYHLIQEMPPTYMDTNHIVQGREFTCIYHHDMIGISPKTHHAFIEDFLRTDDELVIVPSMMNPYIERKGMHPALFWKANAPCKAVHDLMEMLKNNNPVHVFMTSCYDKKRALLLTFSTHHPSRSQYARGNPMKVTEDYERAAEEDRLTLLSLPDHLLFNS